MSARESNEGNVLGTLQKRPLNRKNIYKASGALPLFEKKRPQGHLAHIEIRKAFGAEEKYIYVPKKHEHNARRHMVYMWSGLAENLPS